MRRAHARVHLPRAAVAGDVADHVRLRAHAGDRDDAGAERAERLKQLRKIGIAVRARLIRQAGQQRRLRDVRRDDVRAREQAAEGCAHTVVNLGVIAAVVSHDRVDHDQGVRRGDAVERLCEQLRLLGRGEVAGIDPVDARADALPVVRNGQHIVRQVAERPAGELARVRAEHGRGDAGALHARGGDDRQRHGQRALAEPGQIVDGGNALERR